MTIFTTLALRLFGISGIIGSILCITGEPLYNHVPISKNSLAVKTSKLPESRLLNAGPLGSVGCWFCILASLHVYLAFQPFGDISAFICLLAFAATMISYGIGHAAYCAIAAGAQVAAKLGSDAELGGRECRNGN